MANGDTIEEWVDAPPAAGSGEGVWDERVLKLTDRPNHWRKFGPYAAASIARSAKNAVKRLGYEPEQFDTTTRTVTNDDGEEEVWLYARFVDPDEEDANGEAPE